MNARVKGIYESAALDPEKMPAPKEFWFDDKALDEWYDLRRNLAQDRET